MGDYGYFDFNSIWCLFYYANKNKRRLHRFAVTKKILIGVIAALGSGLILMVSFVIQIHRGFELGENIRILEHELYLQAASLYTLQNGYSSRYEVLSDLNRVLEFDLAYSNVLYMRELAELERAYHAEIRFLHETLNTLEAQIAAHDENSVHRLEGYAALGTAIPPIAALVAELKTKLAEIDRPFVLHEVIPGMYDLVFVPEQPIDDRLHLLSLELAVRQQELDLLNEYSEQIAPYIDSFPNLHPLSSGMLTSHFGMRSDPFMPWVSVMHSGWDIGAPVGTPILASGGGTVITARFGESEGFFIEIDHGNGIITRYLHNSRNMVRVGDTVERGQRIALVGNTGQSTGPHLHFEIVINERPVNPSLFIRD